MPEFTGQTREEGAAVESSIAQLLAGVVLPASESPRLDAELLLAHVLDKPRTFLRAWPEHSLSAGQVRQFESLISRRQQGEPIAFLLGYRDFWSLRLQTSPCTLIPRADTERLVEVALEKVRASGTPAPGCALDLGSGTGAIALALARELPHWWVTGADVSPAAVVLAMDNAQLNDIHNAGFVISDWFAQLAPQFFDLIVSNPPYIDPADPHLALGDVRFEPRGALVSQENGMADLRHIIMTAPSWLKSGGWLLLEHGYNQAEAVREFLREQGFEAVDTWTDYGGNARVSGGQWSGSVRCGERTR